MDSHADLQLVFSRPVLLELPQAMCTALVETLLQSPTPTGSEASRNATLLNIIEQQHIDRPHGAALEFECVPPWFVSRGSSLDDPAPRGYFQVVLNELMIRHANSSLRELLPIYQLLRRELSSSRAQQLYNAVMLGTLRLLIFLRLASRLAQHARDGASSSSGQVLMRDEIELGLQDLLQASTRAHGQWALEFVHALCSELGGQPAARAFVTHEATKLEQLGDWVNPWTCGETAGAAWAALGEFSAQHPPLQVALRSCDGVGTQCVLFEASLDDTSAAQPWATPLDSDHLLLRAFTARFRQLRHIWPLPDIVEFYQWLCTTLDCIMREDVARSTSIGELLDLFYVSPEGFNLPAFRPCHTEDGYRCRSS